VWPPFRCSEGKASHYVRTDRNISGQAQPAFKRFDPKLTGCSSIRFEIVGGELVRDKAIFIQQLAHQFGYRALVPPSLDQNIQKLALGIDSAPNVDQATIDLELDLIEIPDGVGL
jgi:hypothetical protein